MSNEAQNTLKEQLALKERELDMVLAIDHIRDTAADLSAMLTAIVQVLADHLHSELCLIVLLDKESNQVELKALFERGRQNGLAQLITAQLAEKAVQLNEITLWGKAAINSQASTLPEQFQMAAVPIIMGSDERLGAMLLARTEANFSSSDIELLKTTESMVDSAVIQGYVDHQLKLHVKELETIYKIDHIRDKGLPFDDMLNEVLQEVCHVIDAEAGFAMLFDNTGRQLELRATTANDLFQVAANVQLINEVSNHSLQAAELMCKNELGDTLRSLMCLPLILNDRIIGVLGVANHRSPQGFTTDDRRLLSAIGSQMDTAIFESIERRRLRQVLGRSVDPRVMERLLASPDVDFLKGERMVLSVLYSDLRGSTELAERTDPELLVGFINHYLGQMTEVILEHHGTLDKFVGDEVMALFGAPFSLEDHALRAVQVGLAMQEAHQTVMDMWHMRGINPAPIGIGIASGELIVGEMGCTQRADYTVIGRAANLGARICSAAKAGEVLISQTTYDLVKDSVEATPISGLQFKGVQGDTMVYRVNGVLK